jgi:HPt (histidine-containing phosphotransfer) domain-containing protein
MNIRLYLLYLSLGAATALAQNPANNPSASTGQGHTASAGRSSTVSVLPDLDRLQTSASQATVDLGALRINKWRADGESKRQAQANADSLQRNLTSALPGLIDAVRSAPQDLNAEFKLYRNLNALYDVFASLTEATGAFGPKGDYEALAQQLNTIDSVRLKLGDALEQLTSTTQSELNQLRSQIHTYQKASAAPPPKKVVVEDTEPQKKTVHKKKKPAASASSSSSDASDTKSKDSTDAGTSAPKP